MLLLLALACAPVIGDSKLAQVHDTANPAPSDGVISDVSVQVHPDIATVLVVTWQQNEAADESWIAFQADGEEGWRTSPEEARGTGEAQALVLGVPAETDVRVRIFNRTNGEVLGGDHIWTVTTDALPSDLPEPDVPIWEPSLSEGQPYILGSLDTSTRNYYSGPYYVWILNREGRVVWYAPIPVDHATMMPRVARDGTHLIWEEETSYSWSGQTPLIRRRTLDDAYDETISAPGLTYAFDELDDGTIISDSADGWQDFRLVLRDEDGTITRLWRCSDWSGPAGAYDCYTNTVNLSPDQGSILWSMPTLNTVLQIDIDSGEVLRAFGDRGDAPVPEDITFEFQHYPNFTPDGTLLLSTHVPGASGQQRAREYRVDDASGAIQQVWSFGEGVDDYAMYSGEAWRLEGGNTMINYGTGGAAREVTPEGEVAWYAKWGASYLTGHMTPVDDLYALNRGR